MLCSSYQTEYQYVSDGYVLEGKSEFPSDYVATVPQSEVELIRFHGSKVEKVCVVYPDVFGLEWVRVLPRHQLIITASPRSKTGYYQEAIDWVKYAIAENEKEPPDVGSQPLSVAFPAGYAAYQNTFLRLVDLYSACSCCSASLMVSATNMVAHCSNPLSFISNLTWDLSFITFDSEGELAKHVYTKKQLITMHPIITLTRLLYFPVQAVAHQVTSVARTPLSFKQEVI